MNPYRRDARRTHGRCGRTALHRRRPRRRTARQRGQPVHALAGRQPPDHRRHHRRAGRRLRGERLLVADRAAARQPAGRCGDGTALRPGAAARPAADDHLAGAVRGARRGGPAGAGHRDVHRVLRQRQRAGRAGGRGADAPRRDPRDRPLRRGHRGRRGRRLPPDPHPRQDRRPGLRTGLRLPRLPAAGARRPRHAPGRPPLRAAGLPARRLALRLLAAGVRPVRRRLLALPPAAHLGARHVLVDAVRFGARLAMVDDVPVSYTHLRCV